MSIAGNSNILNILRMSTLQGQIILNPFEIMLSKVSQSVACYKMLLLHFRFLNRMAFAFGILLRSSSSLLDVLK